MGNLIKKPSEMQGKHNIAVLIYGQPGAGKTTLGESAPTPVLFDYDQGAYRTNGAHQVSTFSPQSWEQTAQAIDEILQEMPECETVIIDTVGKMLDYMSEYIVRTDPKKAKLDGSLSLPGYGTRKQMFIDFIHRMQMLGKNVVFVAHEREEKRGDETVKRPEIGGSSANDLIKELDLVGYIQMIGSERTISFNPTEQFYAKNTCNLEPFMKLPVTVDRNGVAVGNNDFMAKIIDRFRVSQDAKAKLTADFDRLVSDINERVEACETAEDLNTLAAEFGAPEFGHIYNSKLLAGQALRDKAATLGAKFNKVKKCYEGPEPQVGVMTKEQFKARWDSNDEGGGITYDDIAECAKAWGLCSKPRIMPIDQVRAMVLDAAGCSDCSVPVKNVSSPADEAEATASAGLFDGQKAPENA